MAHSAELPLLAGLSMQAWGQGYSQVGAALGIGQLTKAEGFERILRDGGVEPRPDLVRALVDRDRELLLRSARLYDDALEFLRDVRARGIKIAIVSNCSEHTRDLLESNGVAELADTLVLSCEVGAEKPGSGDLHSRAGSARRPRAARRVRGRSAGVLRGSGGLGITAVQIVRGELDGKVPAPGTTVVRSLSDVAAMF